MDVNIRVKSCVGFTRACFDEQRTRYCTFVDELPEVEEDAELVPGNADAAVKSWVPSLFRFVFVSTEEHQTDSVTHAHNSLFASHFSLGGAMIAPL